MTEKEWLECDDPRPIATFQCRDFPITNRHWMLFACASCFAVWPDLSELERRAVEAGYNSADAEPKTTDAAFPSYFTTIDDVTVIINRLFEQQSRQASAHQTDLLRDILGNPFRPVTINPSWHAWNNGTIPKLAEGIYQDRAFDRLPILADALEEAGCDNKAILDHCRGPGPHVRGCWVVDLLTGRK